VTLVREELDVLVDLFNAALVYVLKKAPVLNAGLLRRVYARLTAFGIVRLLGMGDTRESVYLLIFLKLVFVLLGPKEDRLLLFELCTRLHLPVRRFRAFQFPLALGGAEDGLALAATKNLVPLLVIRAKTKPFRAASRTNAVAFFVLCPAWFLEGQKRAATLRLRPAAIEVTNAYVEIDAELLAKEFGVTACLLGFSVSKRMIKTYGSRIEELQERATRPIGNAILWESEPRAPRPTAKIDTTLPPLRALYIGSLPIELTNKPVPTRDTSDMIRLRSASAIEPFELAI
jgi:hypothetical protein